LKAGKTVADDHPTASELFNAAVEAFSRAEIPSALTLLRGGFFENLYVAPLLLGEEFYPQRIWYPGAGAEPQAARDYVSRYGRLWEEEPQALEFLAVVWNDPLVRAELKKFLNLSKNMLAARGNNNREELLRERRLFLNPERLKRTQAELLTRLERTNLRVPLPKPRLGLIMLASKDPAKTVEFYRNLLNVEPITTSQVAGGYAEFELAGVHLAIHGQDRAAAGDPYGLGPSPECLGWGSILVIRVADLAGYHENATAAGIEIVDSDLTSAGRRFFVVKDPSGYLLEITEENPKGLDC
jgi:catechol 2,3-dioxygenase-like lactoylglutathione lyase family enzyme